MLVKKLLLTIVVLFACLQVFTQDVRFKEEVAKEDARVVKFEVNGINSSDHLTKIQNILTAKDEIKWVQSWYSSGQSVMKCTISQSFSANEMISLLGEHGCSIHVNSLVIPNKKQYFELLQQD